MLTPATIHSQAISMNKRYLKKIKMETFKHQTLRFDKLVMDIKIDQFQEQIYVITFRSNRHIKKLVNIAHVSLTT